MPDTKYDRDLNRFECLGLDLNRPVDSVKPGKFPYLKNCRTNQNGRIEPRQGLVDLGLVVAGQTQVHSARRLNGQPPSASNFIRVIGAGTHLAYGDSAGLFTDSDSGYSGDPLALQPWSPEASPAPFMYVADKNRMRKLSVAGSLHTIGLAAPAAAPAVGLTTSPQYKVVDEFDATAGWAQGGTAGAPALLSAGPGYRTTTTITQILYDTGTTGWACINPASMANIGPGERLDFNPGGGTAETKTVQATHPGSVATTVSRVSYDSGTTGPCSVVLATAIDQVVCDALIRNTTTGPENARIQAVVRGPNNTTSIRLSTTGTWVAGDTVTVLASFRVYLTSTHAAAETVRTDGIRTALTTGTGTLTKTSALDLSLLATGVPTLPDDYMHISFRVSDPTVITELKVLLDVDSVTNDFTRNYYWRSFRASDLTPAAANLQSLLATRQQILQRTIIDTPISGADLANQGLGRLDLGGLTPEAFAAQQNEQNAQQQIDAQTALNELDNAISQQLDAGVSQWVELRFRLSDLIKVGTDDSRTLQHVAVIRVTALVTGAVNLDMDSWWVGGGYGPDTGSDTASPYLYRYRARNPATNVPSNFSPATRYDANPLRQSVTVAPTQYAAPSGTSLTTADFVLDIARFGGEVPDWHYVGTIANAGSPSFADIYSDETVAKQPILANDNFQPWPVVGVPVTGTTGTVVGTTVNDNATNFDTSWAAGTLILINDQPFTIYRVISTSKLELVQNAGSQTGVTWRIDEPTTLAQPLACLWQWDGRFWACADPVNPGRLYFSNPDSETTVVENYLDVTSPSEALMNGVEFNVRGFVFTSENLRQILQTGFAAVPYKTQTVPNGKGLFSRWALTREPTPILCTLGKDGIYQTMGGASESLTDADLYPLFPNEGNLGQTTNGVLRPIVSAIQARRLRLTYYDSFLYFDYVCDSGLLATLIMAFDIATVTTGQVMGGWLWDVYAPNVLFHYGEEGAGVHSLLVGAANGHLYTYGTAVDDAGQSFPAELTTGSRDQGDPRMLKRYGDVMVDADTAGLDVSVTPYFDNNSTSVAATTINTATRTQTPVPLGSSWPVAKNISLFITMTITSDERPLLYIWEPRWTFEPASLSAFSWEISPTTFGAHNFTSMGVVRVTHVSTSDLSLDITIDNVAQPTITIPNSGGVYAQTVFRVPVMKGKLWQLAITSSAAFRLDARDTFFEVKEWGSDGPYQELRLFSDFSLVEG